MQRFSLFLLSCFVLLSTSISYAAEAKICPDGSFSALCNIQAENTGGLISKIVVGILVIAAVLSLFFLIFGGVKWIMSSGDKTKIGEARGMIIAAIIGLIITFLSYFILSVVLGLFGISISDLKLPTLNTP